MRQTLHLLILDTDQKCGLIAWHGARWILPILDLPERMRAAPAVCAWLAARGLQGDMVGQWIGRLTASGDAVDWLVVVRVRSDSNSDSTDHAWTPLRTLLSSPHTLDYQRWALKVTTPTGEAPATGGPFGHTHWLEEAAQFIRHSIGPSGQEVSPVPHRVAASELVLEYRTEHRRYFLKGLARERACEAAFTMKMHDLSPESFARTAAFTSRPDGSAWWLMEGCAGEPLTAHLTEDVCAHVAIAYAELQQQVSSNELIISGLPVFEPMHLAGWVEAVLENAGCYELAGHCRDVVQTACEGIEASRVPLSWIAADLDPLNVLINGDRVRFIDLDDAFLGPASIGASIFARRVGRADPGCVELLREAYAREWAAALAITGSWRAVDLVSTILECNLAWRRLEAKTERGEVHGLVDPARSLLPRRLARLCDVTSALGA